MYDISEILNRIHLIFADELQIDPEKFGDDDNFSTGLGLDSLAVYSAITEIEESFDIVLNDSDIEGISTINDIAALVYGKLSGDAAAVTEKATEEPVEYRRITDFAESEEYRALKQRMVDTLPDESYNPYFVPHDSLIRDTSVVRGKEVINLGSYNYLGMSGHPETMQAAIDAIKKYGTSASGSRTLAGEKTLYQQLEKAIAEWKHTEDAIVCTGGWATNLTFISSFMRAGDFIVYDALSHNSIADGVALSKAESKAFPHNDLGALESILEKVKDKYNKVLIVVEGVYSMDGDIAPIPEFVRLKKKYNCFLMVDEAHSGGVIGDHAGGCDDYFGLDPHDIDIKYGTMSKALGTCGGYIAADKEIVEYLRYMMDGFVFSAGISPPLAAACMKAIEIIRRDNSEVTKLHENIRYFVKRAKEEGMNTCLAGESAVVPILIGTDEDAARLSTELLNEGVFVPPAMYPAVPMGESRLRFTISSTHSIEQLEKAVSALARLMREEGFLK
ncbi:MAG: aminotransferase class I/II-fold pyridoxal phosphate-dependent enzyme [Oscillospiraceae bacterium]|nr:aminotransferase class I/II-fold pyridoxal phosphate-dependent enzyme [Oscillospiraceae bacterium]